MGNSLIKLSGGKSCVALDFDVSSPALCTTSLEHMSTKMTDAASEQPASLEGKYRLVC